LIARCGAPKATEDMAKPTKAPERRVGDMLESRLNERTRQKEPQR
jgi:hypothetical protein